MLSLVGNTSTTPTVLDQALAAKAKAETAAALALRDKIKLEVDDLAYDQTMRLASAFENRVFTFDAAIREDTVQECMQVLGIWVRRDNSAPIKIIFNSPGGSVLDGLALYDYILQLRRGGTSIDTTTLGMAASMGGILLQAGETRRMSSNSYLMIHEVSSTSSGKMSELEDEAKFVSRLQTRCVDILAGRSTMTARQVKAKWKRKDWWLDAKEAQELGFCDEVE